MKPLPKVDLERISSYYQKLDADLQAMSILISGATGFVGSWLTESLLNLNREFNLQITITGITRNSEKAKALFSTFADSSLKFIEADIRTLNDIDGQYSHIFHAATPTTAAARSGDLKNVYASSVLGASNLLKLAENQETPPIFVHTSSGAVYGKQPKTLERIPLKWPRQELIPSDSVQNEYARGKIDTECLVEAATSGGAIKGINARLFAFMGPRLPLSEHYAIGNFLYSGVFENEIRILGDGQTVRSYQYASDMTSQLIYLLATGGSGNFHIGSDDGRKLREWADLVGMECNKPVSILNSDHTTASRYVPESDNRIPRGLGEDVLKSEHIGRWRDWIRS